MQNPSGLMFDDYKDVKSPSIVIIVLTPFMTGSTLPYHEGQCDSKATASLRINGIQLLRTTGFCARCGVTAEVSTTSAAPLAAPA